MDLHHGYLFVNSEGEGCGSTFTMLIPVVENQVLMENIEQKESYDGDDIDDTNQESTKTQNILEETAGKIVLRVSFSFSIQFHTF